jgi:hypothetical protein
VIKELFTTKSTKDFLFGRFPEVKILRVLRDLRGERLL